jgi:hypothetical protein
MTLHDSIQNLAVLGKTQANEPQMLLFRPAARSAVRYADAMSWTAATAVGIALGALGADVEPLRHTAGVITISHNGPAQTIAAVAEASAAGSSSPLRYPASNPGALAGVICIAHGLRGPTMNLTMPGKLGLPIGLSLAASWIGNHGTPLVVLVVSQSIGDGKFLARCVLLGANAIAEVAGAKKKALSQMDISWLTSAT